MLFSKIVSPKIEETSHSVHGDTSKINADLMLLLLPLSSYFPDKLYDSSSQCFFSIVPESIRKSEFVFFSGEIERRHWSQLTETATRAVPLKNCS